MSLPPHMNGGWPELPPIPPPIEDLPEHPTTSQVLRALGSTLLMFGQLWPRTVQALEWLRDWTLHHDTLHALPPMRAPLESTHEVVESVAGDVARAYEADVKSDSTPPTPSPKFVEKLVADRLAVEVLRMKAEKWDAVEAERKAAEAERVALAAQNARGKVRAKWALVLMGITTAGTIIAALVEHFSR